MLQREKSGAMTSTTRCIEGGPGTNRAASPTLFFHHTRGSAQPSPTSRVTADYWQTGSPSFVEPPPSVIVQVFAVDTEVAVAFQPVFVTPPSVTVIPLDAL